MSPALSPTTATREWLTLHEVADLLRVDERTVRRYIAAGRLRAERVGPRLLRIDAASVTAMTRAVGHFPATAEQRITLRDAAFADFQSVLLTAGIVYAQSETHPARRAEALAIYRAQSIEAVMGLDTALRSIESTR